MSQAFSLFPLEAAHAARMEALHRESLSTAWDAAAFRHTLAASEGFGWGTGEKEELQGFILCRVAAEEAELLTMAVDTTHRRQGMGQALLDAAKAEAARRGAKAMFLEVAADNAAARGLYEKAGFFQVGRRKGYYAQGATDALVMRAALD